ncbi:hypothetical protein LY622_19835 [Halomonas sp. M5N1S17]|uniref:hypothetical protein n=1 Tax=Halomonas alkalisoli TaxID=2907158 RepID=UPI001F366631|nr:hypothetical protein [Halomonas alkalisoli]MCE9665678.1 hypothetical protein [Halomonas alkalisoli]
MRRLAATPFRATLLALGFGALMALGSVAHVQAQRAAAGPPDWPCVQRLIPDMAWGTIWAGPPLDELERQWWDDEEIGRVVRFATARATPEGEAFERVRDFVASVEDDEAEERLTLLFSGLFELTNRERRRTIDSIRRASRAQVARLDVISDMVDELEAQRSGGEADEAEIERLSEDLFWEQRTFQMRQQALPAMCEQPYLLEEKLSRMTRMIMERLP